MLTPITYQRRLITVGVVILLALLVPFGGWSQPGWLNMPSTTTDAQRAGLQTVRAQVGYFRNTASTAAGYPNEGYAMVWQGFQAVRAAYGSFASTLPPDKLNRGANDLAELAAGLDIIQEAFTNYQQDVSSGNASFSSLRNLCQVLNQATAVWLQQFNRVSSRLRVGW